MARWGLCTAVQPYLAGSGSAWLTACCCVQHAEDSVGGEANDRRESEGGTTGTGSLPDDDAAALTLRTLEREVGLSSALLSLAITRRAPLRVLLMRSCGPQHQDVHPLFCQGSPTCMQLAVT